MPLGTAISSKALIKHFLTIDSASSKNVKKKFGSETDKVSENRYRKEGTDSAADTVTYGSGYISQL